MAGASVRKADDLAEVNWEGDTDNNDCSALGTLVSNGVFGTRTRADRNHQRRGGSCVLNIIGKGLHGWVLDMGDNLISYDGIGVLNGVSDARSLGCEHCIYGNRIGDQAILL